MAVSLVGYLSIGRQTQASIAKKAVKRLIDFQKLTSYRNSEIVL
jgi:hypothetical protein